MNLNISKFHEFQIFQTFFLLSFAEAQSPIVLPPFWANMKHYFVKIRLEKFGAVVRGLIFVS